MKLSYEILASARLEGTPYRQPYAEPAIVLEVHGNKCSLRTKDKMILTEIHLEDVVPEGARNLEKEPFEFRGRHYSRLDR